MRATKVSGFFQKIKTGWNKPAEGRFLPIKEIAAYGVGGMGLHFMFSFPACSAFSKAW